MHYIQYKQLVYSTYCCLDAMYAETESKIYFQHENTVDKHKTGTCDYGSSCSHDCSSSIMSSDSLALNAPWPDFSPGLALFGGYECVRNNSL